MSAIERATGLPRPTAHRVTNGLIEAGYVERDPRQRGHAPGPRLMSLAYQLLRNGTPRSRRLDVLEALSRETGEASHFALLRGPVVHLLDQVDLPVPLGVHYDGRSTSCPLRRLRESDARIPARHTAGGTAGRLCDVTADGSHRHRPAQAFGEPQGHT